MATDFTLPELGENITTGDVLNVLVKPGDTVAKDQPVLELETDKATIEVPSSLSGRVTAVKVKAGDKVNVGQPIFTVEESGESAKGGAQQTAAPKPVGEPQPEPTAFAREKATPGGLEQRGQEQRPPTPAFGRNPQTGSRAERAVGHAAADGQKEAAAEMKAR